MAGELGNTQYLTDGLVVLHRLELHHVVEEEDEEKDDELDAGHDGVEVLAGLEARFGEHAVEEGVLFGLGEAAVVLHEFLFFVQLGVVGCAVQGRPVETPVY